MGVYRIMSFDGGGLKGLLSLGMMRRISERLGSTDWIARTDLFAGTSTGGLVALGLAAGHSTGELARFYRERGLSIFNKKTFLYRTSIFRTLHIGYENRALREPLGELLGEKRLTELEKDVLVVAFDLKQKQGKRASWAPKIFHSLAGEGRDEDLAREVALYTSAAPTYLPSVEGYIDGGVCANNPSMCALAQLFDARTREKPALEEIRMLSFGTGVNPKCLEARDIRWGIFGWNLKLLEIIMEGSVGIADYQCRHLLSEKRYRRVQLELAREIDMDDASRIDEMQEIVEGIPGSLIEEWAEWIANHW